MLKLRSIYGDIVDGRNGYFPLPCYFTRGYVDISTVHGVFLLLEHIEGQNLPPLNCTTRRGNRWKRWWQRLQKKMRKKPKRVPTNKWSTLGLVKCDLVGDNQLPLFSTSKGMGKSTH